MKSVPAAPPPPFARFVADTATRHLQPGSTQLVVTSLGLDVEGCTWNLAEKCLGAYWSAVHQSRTTECAVPLLSNPLFFVVFPDFVDASLMFGWRQAMEACRAATQLADQGGDHDRGRTVAAVHVLEEGCTPKRRGEAYLSGGVILTLSRFFCADVLHKRVDLKFALTGSVLVLPCSDTSHATPRKLFKHLPSLAFAVDLLHDRNSLIQPLVADDAPFCGAVYAPVVAISDNVWAISYCLRAHCCVDGSASFLEYLMVGDLQLFPMNRLDVVRSFEADEKSSSTFLTELMPVNLSRTEQALEALLVEILREVLGELRSTSSRLASAAAIGATCPAAPPPSHRRSEDARRSVVELSPLPWANPQLPCGVDFWKLTEADALNGSRNTLESTLRDAVASQRAAVLPYVRLLESLSDVVELLRQLYRVSSSSFFLAVEEMVLVGRRRLTSRGGFGLRDTDGSKALWTLSDKFQDLLTLTAARVYEVEQTVPGTAAEVVDVDAADGERSVAAPAASRPAPSSFRTRVRYSADSPGEKLRWLKRMTLGYCSNARRKRIKRSREDDGNAGSCHNADSSSRKPRGGPPMEERERPPPCRASASAPTRSLLILVDSNVAVFRLSRYFLLSEEAFSQLELNRFLAHYQALCGVRSPQACGADSGGGDSSRREASMNPRGTSRGATAAVRARKPRGSIADDEGDDKLIGRRDGSDSEQGSEEDDAFDDEQISEDRLLSFTQTMFSHGPSGDRVAHETQQCRSLHQALLSQTVDDPNVMLDDQTLLTRLTQQQQLSGSAHESSPRGTRQGEFDMHLVSMRSDAVVLCAQDMSDSSRSAEVGLQHGSLHNNCVYVCIQNARCCTAWQLLSLSTQRENTADAAVGGVGVPAVGRVIVFDDTLRTARMLHSYRQLMCRTQPDVAMKVQVLVAPHRAHAPSQSPREEELTVEAKQFECIMLAKSKLVHRAMVSRESLEETERMLRSGLVRSNAAAADAPGSSERQHRIGMTTRLRQKPPGASAATPSGRDAVVTGNAMARRVRPLVIFDEREFRSATPFELRRRGFDVLPLTLITGDYVIAANSALERKSVADLTQSLASGRLQSQLLRLSRQFAHPMLLIEFSRASSFRLNHETAWSSSSTIERVGPLLKRLCAAVVQCGSRVAIVWARSPHHSASLCYRMRTQFSEFSEDADPSSASLTQRADGEVVADREYAGRILRMLPGVDPTNVVALTRAAGSLAGLALLSRDSLIAAMGDEKGAQLHNFLHNPIHEIIS